MEDHKWKIKALQFQIKCYKLEKKELEKRVSKLEQQMDYIIHLKNECSHKEDEIYDETSSEEAYDQSDDEILLADKEKIILPPITRSKEKVNRLDSLEKL